MINFNGTLTENQTGITFNNRAFLYGDAVFETLKIVNAKILFWEDHYFRLMSSMRILRMKIPMDFTLENLEAQIIQLVEQLKISDSARVRVTVFRNDGGLYQPETNAVSYLITAKALPTKSYCFAKNPYEVELFKDYHLPKHLLSSIKSTNKIVQILASVFAKENDFNDCLLINEDKNVVESISGNVFMVTGNQLITPPISDGCLNGIMRKQLLSEIKKMPELELVEKSISPFEIQKADELFITNVISGIQPIFKYRKKTFETQLAQTLLDKINLKEGLV